MILLIAKGNLEPEKFYVTDYRDQVRQQSAVYDLLDIMGGAYNLVGIEA